MKTPEQWAWDYFHDQRYLRLDDVIKSIQKEAWNDAVDYVKDHVDLNRNAIVSDKGNWVDVYLFTDEQLQKLKK